MKRVIGILVLKTCTVACCLGGFHAFADAGISLTQARTLAAAAFKHADQKSWKISVAIFNAEGNLVLFERGEGSYAGSIESSIQKARSSNAFQRPTRAFAEAIKEGRLGILTGKDIVAIEGGLPIIIDGAHAGAIGISGAKAVEDEDCAQAAIASLKK